MEFFALTAESVTTHTNPVTNPVISLVTVICAIYLFRLLYRNKRHRKYDYRKQERINPYSKPFADTSADKPYKLNTSLLTDRESEFYIALRTLLKGHHYVIAIKPRIADFVGVTYNQYRNAKEFYFYFNKINAKHVDFLICDMAYRPLLAVELDDSTHDRPDRADRDDLVDYVYKTAGLPVLHVGDYSFDSLENKLSNLLPAYQHATRPSAAG